MAGRVLKQLQSRTLTTGPLPNEKTGHKTSKITAGDQHGLTDLKHWRLGFDDRSIAWLLLDRKDAKTNVLSEPVLAELEQIARLLEEKKPKGLVLRSAKEAGFCVGADIAEFQELKTGAEIEERLKKANSVVNRLESLAFPTVAVIHGHCLGGGLELALRCRHRLAIVNSSIGFPEIKLGLIPGLEGTVRLTHLIDPLEAMSMMLTGKPVDAIKAKQLGLVDEVVEERHVRRALASFFEHSPPQHNHSIKSRLLTTTVARQFEARQMTARAAKKAPPEHYPAPNTLIELWQRHGSDPAAMAGAETQAFARLLAGDTAKGLIRVFFLSEKLKSQSKTEDLKQMAPIHHVHVIGAGSMGGDIAIWCAYKGFFASVFDQDEEALAGVVRRARQLCIDKKLSEDEQRKMLDRLMPDFRNCCIGKADLVIEAVPEKVDIKHGIYQEIEPRLKSDAILATNTSSIPLEKLCDGLKSPQRLIGLHFFNPVSKMKLVEVVAHDSADREVLARARSFVGQIDRFPAPVSSAPGFLVNRALTPYLMEAMLLLDEGLSAETIDRTAEQFGMPVGPVELADQVGLDICLSVAEMLNERLDSPMAKIPDWLREKVENGDTGRKSGQGIYTWKEGKAEKEKDAESQEELTDRLILPMLNACMACLQEKVIENEDLLDSAMVFGTGFAPFRGGPMHYGHNRGYDEIYASLEKLADKQGKRFRPDEGWKKR